MLSYEQISIPAPARGATTTALTMLDTCSFQFPPLREGRPAYSIHPHGSIVFQFPPLREGRLCPWPAFNAIVNFNSRPCARGDKKLSLIHI